MQKYVSLLSTFELCCSITGLNSGFYSVFDNTLGYIAFAIASNFYWLELYLSDFISRPHLFTLYCSGAVKPILTLARLISASG